MLEYILSIEPGSVVVLATSITTTSRVLPVLSYTPINQIEITLMQTPRTHATVTNCDMSSLFMSLLAQSLTQHISPNTKPPKQIEQLTKNQALSIKKI